MSILSPGLRPSPSPPSSPRPPRASVVPSRPPWTDRFRRLSARLSPSDRRVLWFYLLTRISLGITAHFARWLFPARPGDREAAPVLAPFQQWDANHYLHIARDGYFPSGAGPWVSGWDNREAFFPGYPLLLRAVHTVVPDWTAAGLLISFVAGAVAVLALARIARAYLPEGGADHRTVVLFLLSPCAVFLAAGYTEALFLAFALPAWLAALRHRWALAAVLVALATTVRVSGLFLAAAVALLFVLSARTRRDWRAAGWTLLPALPPAAYSWYLYAHTGDWMAWKHAQERGWYRTFHAPWEAWANTWHAAFDGVHTTGYAAMFQAELAAMLVGLALVALLVRYRRWPEAVYVALSLWALGTSYWYTSIPRATLLWWPLWIGLASLSLRRPWFRTAYLCVAAPLTTLVALTFLTGRWAG
ncbi:mannosyltransferase family protein [Streptomyces sp. C11-1]|uniref:Mannosyltransferase family protein n=1 Tax=Streptomyces durocortorensis TaxID=2811104 RepID=A0ABY9VXK5_9ACTN|nr:mannosyltransferase family protein [Streptomyces durocortorensis]WNF28631.1 mannosyltransferase family protein [Streptomyces durocortorensis]